MAKVKIKKLDGTPTNYFWKDDDEEGPTDKTVYRSTDAGVRQVKTMRYNPESGRMRRI